VDGEGNTSMSSISLWLKTDDKSADGKSLGNDVSLNSGAISNSEHT